MPEIPDATLVTPASAVTVAVVASEQQVADAFTASGLIQLQPVRRHVIQRHGECITRKDAP